LEIVFYHATGYQGKRRSGLAIPPKSYIDDLTLMGILLRDWYKDTVLLRLRQYTIVKSIPVSVKTGIPPCSQQENRTGPPIRAESSKHPESCFSPDAKEIRQHSVAFGTGEGHNRRSKTGYDGPCPTAGTHRYFFRHYALDTKLDLPDDAGKEDL
jgi:hypothetical protein